MYLINLIEFPDIIEMWLGLFNTQCKKLDLEYEATGRPFPPYPNVVSQSLPVLINAWHWTNASTKIYDNNGLKLLNQITHKPKPHLNF